MRIYRLGITNGLSSLFVVLLVASCGGGGGGGSGSSTPTISNLQYFPSSAFGGTGPATVSGSVQFIDPGGDLASLHVTTSAGVHQTISLPSAAGLTSGTIQGSFQVDTSQLGHYTFDIWLVDAGGHASNHLTGTFDVLLDDLVRDWFVRNTNLTPQLNKVIWAGNRFVAVGYVGTIVTSPDGNTWTAQGSGTQAVLKGVVWTGAQYVAVGTGSNGPVVLTSPDAVTWTVSASSFSGASTVLDLTGVSYSGTTFVAVGINQSDGTGRIFTSTDAVTWTAVSPNPSVLLNTTIWTGTEFVAAGAIPSWTGSSGPAVLRSADGSVWTSDTISGPPGISDLVSTGSGATQTLVAVGSAIWFSLSGSGWQLATSPASLSSYPRSIGWSGAHYLSCSATDCALSTDGQNWSTAKTSPVTNQSLVWGGPSFGRWVTVGFAGQVATSP